MINIFILVIYLIILIRIWIWFRPRGCELVNFYLVFPFGPWLALTHLYINVYNNSVMCNSYLIIHISIGCLILTSWSCHTLGCMPRCGLAYPKTVFVSHFVLSSETIRHFYTILYLHTTPYRVTVFVLWPMMFIKSCAQVNCSFQPISLQ